MRGDFRDDESSRESTRSVATAMEGVHYVLHAPQGVLPPVREGGPQANCDGKGLDSLEHCLGG